jgi:DMSO reductase anchor subunit
MLNIVLIALGTIVLCASGFICQKFNFNDELKKFQNLFTMLFYLILFFICGYIFFIVKLFKQTEVGKVDLSTVSIIFFFGALFVYVSMTIFEKLIKTIEEKSKNLNKVNSQLIKSNDKLIEYGQKMKISGEKYKDKLIELEETLDDYYSMNTTLKNRSENKSTQE